MSVLADVFRKLVIERALASVIERALASALARAMCVPIKRSLDIWESA